MWHALRYSKHPIYFHCHQLWFQRHLLIWFKLCVTFSPKITIPASLSVYRRLAGYSIKNIYLLVNIFILECKILCFIHLIQQSWCDVFCWPFGWPTILSVHLSHSVNMWIWQRFLFFFTWFLEIHKNEQKIFIQTSN